MIDYNEAYKRLWEHYNSIVPFSKKEFDMIMDLGGVRMLRKGELVFKQGRVPGYGGYVYEGALRHFYTDPVSKVETTVGFEFEDTCIGDLRSIFYNEPASTSLQALEDTLIGTLEKKHYLYLVDHCPPFAKMMILGMEHRYNSIVRESIRSRNMEAEQAYLDMLETYPQILQRVPQHYIASYLGIKPQSLSRIRRQITEHKFVLSI